MWVWILGYIAMGVVVSVLFTRGRMKAGYTDDPEIASAAVFIVWPMVGVFMLFYGLGILLHRLALIGERSDG
jgi:hypothetical protein